MAKVRRVTLYKHGLGFFELTQEIEGDAEIALDFRSQEMNDVLKSLTVHDPQGQVVSISYDSHKPTAQLLQEIALEIPHQGGLASLLSQLQGAEVIVVTPSQRIQGALVGLENRQRLQGERRWEESWLSLWSQAQTLLSFNLAEVLAVEICDPALRSDLSYGLEVKFKTHKRESKQLSVITRGQGRRDLHLSYLVEAPAWKSSYRVILRPELPPFWEGWALVDNPRDEDWDEVELTLVAGLPISFRHDLYSPRYLNRREVQVAREASAGPLQVSGAVPSSSSPSRGKAREVCESRYFAPQESGLAYEVCDALAATPPEVAQQRAAQVMTQSLGEHFHFRLRHPVTVKRNQSALVPIVGQEAEGRKVLLYNAEERAQNPFAAVELVNSTGLTLEGGPLVVIEEDCYAGEAMLDTLKPDDRRIVPYAVDLGVVAESQLQQQQDTVHRAKVVGGILQLYSAQTESRTYLFRNQEDRDKILWLEHPLRPTWDLHQTPEEQERTATHYRWRLDLPARQTVEFSVRLKRIMAESMALATLNQEILLSYRQSGYFSPEAQIALERMREIVEERERITDAAGEMDRLTQEVELEVERNQRMLTHLGSSPEEMRLRAKYVSAMEAGETQLSELKSRRQELFLKSRQITQTLKDFLRSLNFDQDL